MTWSDSEELLSWFDTEGRDLPWRRTRDPWAVLVAETMLQQTQVDRVMPRWFDFLDRWPDPAACAAEPASAIVTAWAGLGYNRRALNLHRAAVVVRDRHDSRVPDSLTELLDLPGVGPYTARAILAFAFERDDVGVLDTNVGRVLARRAGERLVRAVAQRRADDLVPRGDGWRWNQAMIELGALRCTARAPDCERCPLAAGCLWWLAGRPDPDPAVDSAFVSGRQSRFEGSDRQGRGRLVDALRRGPINPSTLPAVMGWPDDPARARRVAETLVADGLIVLTDGGTFQLPH